MIAGAIVVRPRRSDAIAVKVTDSLGRPIPGAKVLATTMRWDLHLSMGPDGSGIKEVHHKSGTTDESGRFAFEDLLPGFYSVAEESIDDLQQTCRFAGVLSETGWTQRHA